MRWDWFCGVVPFNRDCVLLIFPLPDDIHGSTFRLGQILRVGNGMPETGRDHSDWNPLA